MKKLLFLLFVLCLPLYCQDAQPDPVSLSRSVISSLQQLKQLNTELMNELHLSKDSSQKVEALMQKQEQKLETSANLVKQISWLVDDQAALYRRHLNRLRLWIGGLIGLIAVYSILKAFLLLRFKIRIW